RLLEKALSMRKELGSERWLFRTTTSVRLRTAEGPSISLDGLSVLAGAKSRWASPSPCHVTVIRAGFGLRARSRSLTKTRNSLSAKGLGPPDGLHHVSRLRLQ